MVSDSLTPTTRLERELNPDKRPARIASYTPAGVPSTSIPLSVAFVIVLVPPAVVTPAKDSVSAPATATEVRRRSSVYEDEQGTVLKKFGSWV